jgi:hypothetical protein
MTQTMSHAAALHAARSATAANGHAAAAELRRLKHIAVGPVPRMDGLVWSVLLLLALVGCGGVGIGLWLTNRPTPPVQMLEMRAGSEKLVFPETYKGPRPPDMAREVGIIRLRVMWPSMVAAGPLDKADVHLTVGAADPATDPAALFATLARFVMPGAWSNPGGLVSRNFKKGSRFDGEELFMAPPAGEVFFARCSSDTAVTKVDEGCRMVLKHRGVDIAVRFPREALTEWRALSDGVRTLVDGFRHEG